MTRAGATSLAARCEYCGNRLVTRDGNRIVLEVNGSCRRACRRCAEELSQSLASPTPQARS